MQPDMLEKYSYSEWNRLVLSSNRKFCEDLRQSLDPSDKWIAQALFSMASLAAGPLSPRNMILHDAMFRGGTAYLGCTYLESKGGDKRVARGNPRRERLGVPIYREPKKQLYDYSYHASGFDVDMGCEFPKYELLKQIRDRKKGPDSSILKFWPNESSIEYILVQLGRCNFLESIILEELPLTPQEQEQRKYNSPEIDNRLFRRYIHGTSNPVLEHLV